jgi:predicted kinase
VIAVHPLAALCPAPPGFEVPWPALERLLAEVVPVAALAATPQDAAFHAEGDVWAHTRLVVEALAAEPLWRALPDGLRRVTFAAALLHDVGKSATTRLEDGRLTARGHSARGEGLVRVALWRLNVPFASREHVCQLVRHHQVPFFALERPDAAQQVQRLSVRLRNDALALVALADIRGRRCADPADQERVVEAVQLWREVCSEMGVLDGPRRFATPHTRAVWLEELAAGRSSRHPDVPAHDDTATEVLLMSGLPASGKDTWLRTHRPDLPVVSLDALRREMGIEPGDAPRELIAAAREAAREHLRAARPFAWNATNLTTTLRAPLVQLFRAYRARVRIVYLETGATEQARRNRDRPDAVPASAIARMLERWSVPAPDEAHEVGYAVDGAGRDGGWPP